MSPITYSGASCRRTPRRLARSRRVRWRAMVSTRSECWATEKMCAPSVCPFQRATRASPWAMSAISTSSGEGSSRSSRRPESMPRQLVRHCARDRRFRRHLGCRAEAIDLRLAVDEVPQQPREAGALLHRVEIGARGEDRALDLQPVAHDAGILHQLLDLFRRVARDFRGLEAVEGAAEIVAFAQDGDPGQPGLEAVENELLVERAVVVFRHAPFLVVI